MGRDHQANVFIGESKMKAALYCRLSEEDKNKLHKTDDSESIQNQKTMLTQYAKEHGWEIYEIYSDDDHAGADRRRPAFNRLLEDAEKRKFDIILCKTQSRFTRELELVEKYIHGLFPIWGIRFIGIVDNADTENKGNKKARQINGLVNEWYLEDMSENIRSVLKSRRENGLHIGSFALYGYQKDPLQKGHLIIDEEAAAVVREVFSLYADGYGKTAIARILNEKGIPNPTEYKRRQGLRYRGADTPSSTLWKYASISSMLKNEIYIGNMVQGKYGSVSYKTKQNHPRPKNEWYIVKDTHEPIIEKALWDRVQNLLQARSKPFLSGKIGLFSGKVRCMHCGYTLRSTKNHGNTYLQCATRYANKNACDGAFISVKRLEAIILAEIQKFSESLLDIHMLCSLCEAESALNKQKKHLETALADYQTRYENTENLYKTLYFDKLKGIITEKDFINFSKEIATQKTTLAYTITDIKHKLHQLQSALESTNDTQSRLESYIKPQALDREIVETLIEYITVGKRIPGTRNIPIEIHWRF